MKYRNFEVPIYRQVKIIWNIELKAHDKQVYFHFETFKKKLHPIP
jgi:hypothetical protein